MIQTKTLDLMDLADATSRLARRLDLMGFGDAIVGLDSYLYRVGGPAIRVSIHARTFADTNRIATYLGARKADTVGATFIYEWTKLVGTNITAQVYGPAAD